MRRAAPLLLALLALAGCGGGDDETAAESRTATVTAAPGVEELANVLELRSDFEADAGKTRVILLLSPT
jgi:ABC-type glycerol-3-phosphate transport system substrate-binding protein